MCELRPPPLLLGVPLGLILGLLTFANASVAVMLPQVVADFDVSVDTGSWLISVYLLVLAVLTAVYGRCADLFGLRRALGVGMVILAVGSVLGALATSFPVLLGARVLQGAGAASLPGLTVAAAARIFTGSRTWQGLAVVTAVGTAMGSLGPVLGGLIADLVHWRVAMLLPMLGLVLVSAVWRWLPGDRTSASIDVVGGLLVMLVVGAVVVVVQSPAADPAWAPPAAVIAVLTGAATRAWVLRRPEGFLPLAVLRDRVLVRASFCGGTAPGVWIALTVTIPLALADRHWSAWQVGLVVAPSALTGLLGSRVTPRALERLGPLGAIRMCCWVVSGALLVAGAGLFIEAHWYDAAWIGAVALGAAVAIVTSVSGTSQAAIVSLVQTRVPTEMRGIGVGVTTLVYMVAGALGGALVGGLGSWLGLAPALALLVLIPLFAAATAPRGRPL